MINQKQTLRQAMRSKRGKRVVGSVDYLPLFTLCEKLFAEKFPETVLVYESLSDEISLKPFYERVESTYMKPINFIIATKFLQNYAESIYYAIIPGVAFDQNGTRLGRGGGRYDRFLSTHPESTKIGLCSPEQLLPVGTIPVDARDIPMDFVVPLASEDKLYI